MQCTCTWSDHVTLVSPVKDKAFSKETFIINTVTIIYIWNKSKTNHDLLYKIIYHD